MGDRGSLEPAARDGVRPLAWALVVNVLSVHVVTVARTSGRCRPPGRRTLARRVTLAEYALRRTPTTTPAATLCPVQRPRLTFGARVGRRWAAVREPVLDTCVAALLWAGMAVDLATRPLTEGQSPTSPVAYVVTGLVAAPVVVHRRYPVLAMLLSTTASVGYSLGRFTAYPGTRPSCWCSWWLCTRIVAGRWLSTSAASSVLASRFCCNRRPWRPRRRGSARFSR